MSLPTSATSSAMWPPPSISTQPTSASPCRPTPGPPSPTWSADRCGCCCPDQRAPVHEPHPTTSRTQAATASIWSSPTSTPKSPGCAKLGSPSVAMSSQVPAGAKFCSQTLPTTSLNCSNRATLKYHGLPRAADLHSVLAKTTPNLQSASGHYSAGRRVPQAVPGGTAPRKQVAGHPATIAKGLACEEVDACLGLVCGQRGDLRKLRRGLKSGDENGTKCHPASSDFRRHVDASELVKAITEAVCGRCWARPGPPATAVSWVDCSLTLRPSTVAFKLSGDTGRKPRCGAADAFSWVACDCNDSPWQLFTVGQIVGQPTRTVADIGDPPHAPDATLPRINQRICPTTEEVTGSNPGSPTSNSPYL